ncbi:phage tail protein [Miniphocaeibacter massiliensis]|uniref:phage tail protein n=1 Tax=Miniphocaeibacter massiliensis TaxID=2041841 RepID=UPI000C1C475E|nr:hypothetical protein [Miniphocaeibacter massiliensis]
MSDYSVEAILTADVSSFAKGFKEAGKTIKLFDKIFSNSLKNLENIEKTINKNLITPIRAVDINVKKLSGNFNNYMTSISGSIGKVSSSFSMLRINVIREVDTMKSKVGELSNTLENLGVDTEVSGGTINLIFVGIGTTTKDATKIIGDSTTNMASYIGGKPVDALGNLDGGFLDVLNTSGDVAGSLGNILGLIKNFLPEGMSFTEIIKKIPTLLSKIPPQAILGVVAIAALMAVFTKAYEDGKNKVISSSDIISDKVSETSKLATEDFLLMSSTARESFNYLAKDSEGFSESMKNSVMDNFTTMKEGVLTTLDEQLNKSLELEKKSLEKQKGLTNEEKANRLASIIDTYEQEKSIVESGSSTINSILEKASQEHRQLTEEEKENVNAIQEEMYEAGVISLADSVKDADNIRKDANKKSEETTALGLEKILELEKSKRDETVSLAKESYEQKLKEAEIGLNSENESIRKAAENKKKSAKETKDTIINAAKDEYTNLLNYARRKTDGLINEDGKIMTSHEKMQQSFAESMEISKRTQTVDVTNRKKAADFIKETTRDVVEEVRFGNEKMADSTIDSNEKILNSYKKEFPAIAEVTDESLEKAEAVMKGKDYSSSMQNLMNTAVTGGEIGIEDLGDIADIPLDELMNTILGSDYSSSSSEMTGKIVTGAEDGISDLNPIIMDEISNVETSLQGKDLTDSGTQTATSFVDAFIQKLGELPNKIAEELNKVTEDIKSKAESFKSAGTSIIEAIVSGIASSDSSLGTVGNKIVQTISKSIISNSLALMIVGVSIITAILTGITMSVPLLMTSGVTIITAIISSITSQTELLTSTGISIISSIITGIITATPMLMVVGASIATVISTAIISQLGLLSTVGVSIGQTLVSSIMNGLTTLPIIGIYVASAISTAISSAKAVAMSGGISVGLTTSKGISTGITSGSGMIVGAMNSLNSKITSTMTRTASQVKSQSSQMMNGMAQAVSQGASKATTEFTKLSSKSIQQINQMSKNITQQVKTMMLQFNNNIKSGMSSAVSNISSGVNNMVSKVRSYYSSFSSAGSYLMSGLANGISSGRSKVISAAVNVMNQAVARAKAAAEIHSPSRVMMEVGKFFDMGLEKGIDKNGKGVVGAAESLMDSLVRVYSGEDFDFAGKLGNLNTDFNKDITHRLADNRTSPQPLEFVLQMGSKAYKGFVKDIKKTSDDIVHLEEVYGY